jgi:hypothetical protein
VIVNGVEAPVDDDGNFRAQVPIAVGPNRVEVRAEDISGRKRSVEKTLKRPPPAPTLQQANEDLWKR